MTAGEDHPRTSPAGPPWPPDDIRRIIDAIGDGLLIVDAQGTILYVNPAGEDLLASAPGQLVAASIASLLDPRYPKWSDYFESLVDGDPVGLAGQRLDVTLARLDGLEVRVELVLSVGDSRAGQSVVICLIRPHESERLERFSTLTQQLLEVLTSSSGATPADQLLEALGRRLGWDVTTLWGLESDGALVCRGVWTTPDAPASHFVDQQWADPAHDAGGLAELVMRREEPVWSSEFGTMDQFTRDAREADGLTTACAFPVRYGGQCLGAVEMMSRAQRESDPQLVELMGAISGHVGGVLHALEQTAERQRLVDELESTKQRLQFLLRANRVVSHAHGYGPTLERLAEVAVPTLGDLCLIDVAGENGMIRRMASRHADPTRQHLADELLDRYPPDPHGRHPSADVMASGSSRWSAEMSDEFLRATSVDDRHYAILKELEFTSYMTVPLLIDGEAKGTVTLVSAGSGRRYSTRELEGAEELAAQIAGVVERARVLDHEHHISHTLQQSLLPDQLPNIAGLSIAARYVPAAADVEVGGDWYEVVPLEDDTAALVVGDVQGHDMVAASVMGQVRQTLSLLLSEGAPADDALTRVNEFMTASAIRHLATALVVVVEPQQGRLRLASAGHLAPVAVGVNGARGMTVRPGPPLGVRDARYREVVADLTDETLVLFTDGLTERRHRHPDAGLRLLLRTLEASPHLDPDRLIDDALSRLLTHGTGTDDVVVLAARPTPTH